MQSRTNSDLLFCSSYYTLIPFTVCFPLLAKLSEFSCLPDMFLFGVGGGDEKGP